MRIDEFRFRQLYRRDQEAIGVKIPRESDNNKAKKLRSKIARKSISTIDEEFYSYILELINTASEFNQEEKNKTADDISEYYFLQTGCTMPNEMLTALADFLLDDTLSSKDAQKARNCEYPVLSFRQLKGRKRKQIPVEAEALDFLSNKQAHKKMTSEKSLNS